jgi:hypothetical protein
MTPPFRVNLGESGSFVRAVERESWDLREAAQRASGEGPLFLLDQVEADPLQEHERPAQRGDASDVLLSGRFGSAPSRQRRK